MLLKLKTTISNLFWRLQFKKVKISQRDSNLGRCWHCDAGQSRYVGIQKCCNFYCPCSPNTVLKLRNHDSN